MKNVYYRRYMTALERFEDLCRVDADSGCWIWLGAHNGRGYGFFWYRGRNVQAYRWAYEHFVGPIPEGLTIDHLCRNRRCVNPAHLETCSAGENALRGNGPHAQNARKTHCLNGHELSGANLYRNPKGARICRLCMQVHYVKYRERLRAAAMELP